MVNTDPHSNHLDANIALSASDAGAEQFVRNNPQVLSAELHKAFTDLFKNSTQLTGITDDAGIRAAVEAHAAATEAMIFEALEENNLSDSLGIAGKEILGQSATLQNAGVQSEFLTTLIGIDIINDAQQAATTEAIDQYNMPDDLGRSYDVRLKETADIHGAVTEEQLKQMAEDNNLKLDDLTAEVEKLATIDPKREIEIVPDLMMAAKYDKAEDDLVVAAAAPQYDPKEADLDTAYKPQPLGGPGFA